MSEKDSLDFIEDIRIAQFWRKQLGELEYVQRNPDDLRRWYDALETRGPDEIRAYLDERGGRYPDGQVTGIVSVAPHPPRDIIDLWLASHDTVSKAPYWAGLFAFLLACLLFSHISGCQNLHPLTPFPNLAPPQAIVQPGPPGVPPGTQSTVPGSFPLPANTASPPAGAQNQPALKGSPQP